MKRLAANVAVVAVAAFLIAAGATRLYYYTSSPTTGPSSSSTLGSASQSEAPLCGYQDSSGQPQGCWADYLGYVPVGYVLAPDYTNAPAYPCPSGMPASECQQFRASCGNGVCDPNESCATCPIDCSPTGQLICDVYTERADIPSNVCQTLNQYGSPGGLG